MVKNADLEDKREMLYETFEDFVDDADVNKSNSYKAKVKNQEKPGLDAISETLKSGNFKNIRKIYGKIVNNQGLEDDIGDLVIEICKDFRNKLGKKLDKGEN